MKTLSALFSSLLFSSSLSSFLFSSVSLSLSFSSSFLFVRFFYSLSLTLKTPPPPPAAALEIFKHFQIKYVVRTNINGYYLLKEKDTFVWREENEA